MATWDLLLRGATVFDGTGAPPRVVDVAVAQGRIAAIGTDLPEDEAETTVDAAGRWLTPGLLDVHTHYDLEVELAPGLPESVRHGTTTVVTANCSLGLAFGNQRHTGADPIVDCFARVENVPKHVLHKAAEAATWSDPADYLAHLDTLPLGPNIVTMIPHSMLRIEVMGLEAGITRDPTDDELERMAAILEKGLAQGYSGFSTDFLPFHYLANDPNRHLKIPTQYATWTELKRLTGVVRDAGRVWQTTPPKDNKIESFRNFLLSSGLLFGKTLKTTAVAALDVVPNRMLLVMAGLITTILNSRLFKGDLWFQALAARFKVWSDGGVSPLAEEIDVLRSLAETDLEDADRRRAVLSDPEWQARFRAWWEHGKTWAQPIAHLRRLIRYEDTQLDRDLDHMVVDRCPVPDWSDETFAQILARVVAWQRTGEGARSEAEAEAFAAFPADVDEVTFLIHVLHAYDTDLIWWCISANDSEEAVRKVLFDERFLPGFADSGAHITNMAFYDSNLRALRHAQTRGDAAVARMVQRLTQQPADFFDVDVGTIEVGRRADMVVIDPTTLATYDGEANVQRIHRDVFEHEQLVNRSDGVVSLVVIGGHVAFDGTDVTPELGRVPMGQLLRSGVPAAPGEAQLQAASK